MKNTKPGPRGTRLPKRFSNDAFARQSNLIGKHLGTVLKCVRQNDLDLWNHLRDKAVFRYGESNFYKPAKGVEWSVVK